MALALNNLKPADGSTHKKEKGRTRTGFGFGENRRTRTQRTKIAFGLFE